MRSLKNRFRVGTFFWIMLVWLLLMGELTWLNLLAAAGVGALIVLLLPLPPAPVEHVVFRPVAIAKLLGFWLAGLVSSSVKVAWLALRPAQPPRTGIISMPMRLETEFAMFVGMVLYNLQPGGTITDIDLTNRRWLIHLIDAATPETIVTERAKVEALEKRLIETFEGRDTQQTGSEDTEGKEDSHDV